MAVKNIPVNVGNPILTARRNGATPPDGRARFGQADNSMFFTRTIGQTIA